MYFYIDRNLCKISDFGECRLIYLFGCCYCDVSVQVDHRGHVTPGLNMFYPVAIETE